MSFKAKEVGLWCEGEWTWEPEWIEGFCHDTRLLGKGDVYVALRGDRMDGHRFVEQAFELDASGAMVERAWLRSGARVDAAWPLLVVDDSYEALLRLAAGHRSKLGVPVIGITGSAGKTTVKEMLAGILERRGLTGRTVGNWNNHIGLPMSLLRMRPSSAYGVFEVGTNHPGEIAGLSSVLRPTAAIVTNVGDAHLEHFGTRKRIALEKASLPAMVPPGGCVALDADGEYYETLRAATTARVISVSTRAAADFRATTLDAATGRFVLAEARTGLSVEVRLPVPGEHNIRNALLAAAMARAHGTEWGDICAGLEDYEPLEGRWEVRSIAGIEWVNDAYNASPTSMEASLTAFAEYTRGRRAWLALGGMLELGNEKRQLHERVGCFAATGAWAGLVCVGEQGKWIADAAARRAAFPVAVYETLEDAADWLAERMEPGDALLCKASHGFRLDRMGEELGFRCAGARAV